MRTHAPLKLSARISTIVPYRDNALKRLKITELEIDVPLAIAKNVRAEVGDHPVG